MKIDMFTHVMLPRYKQALYRHAHKFSTEKAVQDRRPVLTDVEARLRTIEPYPDLVQILSATMPPVEEIVGPQEAAELARMCNDEIAELIAKYPNKIHCRRRKCPSEQHGYRREGGGTGDQGAGVQGIQIHTRVLGKPLSSDEWMPLYQLMVELDLPILIHPMRSSNQPDYPTETVSYHQIFSIFGWPYDTTAAMTRLVFAGVFEKFPTIKFITHHCGR